MNNASSSVDAASLLFAHSVLEDGLNSFLGITSDVAREFWKDRVKKKPFDLEAVMKRGIDELVASFVREKIWSIRRSESLINKTDLLLEICQPSGPPSNPNYKFDASKLKAIDKLRQDIVHGDLLGTAIADIDEMLRNTWMYFFMLLAAQAKLLEDRGGAQASSSALLLPEPTCMSIPGSTGGYDL